jgi:hypothetical protein
MNNIVMNRGTKVTVIAFGGRNLRRRVWEDIGDVVLICTEEEYQRAIGNNDEATCSGFPKDDIVEVDDTQFTEST